VRKLLSLSKRPDPATQPKVDPAKVALSQQLGMRFVMRDHRYLMQKLVVAYKGGMCEQHESCSDYYHTEHSRTWIDVPLVPEAYFP